MSKPRACFARQYSDQMICSTCGLAWDTNDQDPPRCPRVIEADAALKQCYDTLTRAQSRRGDTGGYKK